MKCYTKLHGGIFIKGRSTETQLYVFYSSYRLHKTPDKLLAINQSIDAPLTRQRPNTSQEAPYCPFFPKLALQLANTLQHTPRWLRFYAASPTNLLLSSLIRKHTLRKSSWGSVLPVPLHKELIENIKWHLLKGKMHSISTTMGHHYLT